MSDAPSISEAMKSLLNVYNQLSEREKFACGKIFNEATGGKLSPYNSPSPVCVGLVPVLSKDNEIGFLGIKRAIQPFIGGIALPGGFLSQDENPAAGVSREILEETGVTVDQDSFTPAGMPVMAHNNNLLLFFKSHDALSFEDFEACSKNVKGLDGEAECLVFITPETQLCFPLHQEAVNNAFIELGITPKVEPSKSFKP